MNLVLNINENLYSIKSSKEGEKKLKGAIKEAIYDVQLQIKENINREKKGLKPLSYNVSIKDEYGKEIVSVKETKTLSEIRDEYNKQNNKLSYKIKEKKLLTAMDEIGNSKKNEKDFRNELAQQLNSSLFLVNTNLTPALEKVLDYFGDTRSVFNTMNFKEELSIKCIKDLIDLPNPNSKKPPKSFSELLTNVLNVNKVFEKNTNKEKYLDMARSYINISYKHLIPEEHRHRFSSKDNFTNFIKTLEKLKEEKDLQELKKFNEMFQNKALDIISKDNNSVKFVMITKQLTQNLTKEQKENVLMEIKDNIQKNLQNSNMSINDNENIKNKGRK